VRCGFDDVRALQIDHVNGGGVAETKGMSRRVFYERIRTHRIEYQVLCANCNWIKRAERGEVPRGRTSKYAEGESQAKPPSPHAETLGNSQALPVTY